MENITVLGGGNLAQTCAGDLSLAGYKVTICDLPQFRDRIEPILKHGGIEMTGKARNGMAELDKVTTKVNQAVDGADLTLIAVPAFAHRVFAYACLPYLESSQIVVLLGKGGSSLEFSKVKKELGIKENIIIGDTNTCPYGTRLVGPAHVNVFSTVKMFQASAFPSKNNDIIYNALKEIYKPVISANHVIETLLNDVNALLHPAPLIMSASYIEDSKVLWKQCLTHSALKVIHAVDNERIKIGDALGLELPPFEKLYFNTGYSTRNGSLEETLMSAVGLDFLKAPSDMNHRYIKEDVPYGLVPWSEISDLLGIKTRMIDSLITIASTISDAEYWNMGRTNEKMGISGLNCDQLLDYVGFGQKG